MRDLMFPALTSQSRAATRRPIAIDGRVANPSRHSAASNNRRYIAAGDTHYAVGNAPVREAHVVVRGGDKVALLSVLDTAAVCKTIGVDAASNIAVKMCPMRLSFWRGGRATIRQGQGCYLEPGERLANFTPDPSFATSYASYDVAMKSIKLGVILAHRAIEKCSQIVPLYQK